MTRHQDENPPRHDLRFPLALAQQIHLTLCFVVLLLSWPEPSATYYYCCSESPSARRSDVVIPASDRTLSPLAARLSLRARLGTAILPRPRRFYLPGPRTHDQYGFPIPACSRFQPTNLGRTEKLRPTAFTRPRSLYACLYMSCITQQQSHPRILMCAC